MSAKKRVAWVALTCILVLAVAIPTAAIALPKHQGLGRLHLSQMSVATTLAVTGRRVAGAIEMRIAAVLQRRKTRFDTASGRLSDRIARVRAIADKVAAAGGDVSATKALLDSASAHLTKASDLEAQAVAAFQAVPSASDRRTAFAAARAIGRSAAAELVAARKDVRSAIVDLRSVVSALKSSAQSPAGSN